MTDVREEWVTLGHVTLVERLFRTANAGFGFTIYAALATFSIVPQIATSVFGDSTMGLLATGVYAVVALILVAGAYLRAGPPAINPSGRLLRVGLQVLDYSEVREAVRVRGLSRSGEDVSLLFGASPRPRALVRLRSTRRRVLDEPSRLLLADLFRESSVAIPNTRSDPTDPSGEHAGRHYPDHLDKFGAIDLVLNAGRGAS
ncbi:hypothetical protein [Marisediminicola sp. LYQ134]|uniref:hypothetical protein n=1 Tax=unclassified Marisediminicola TaxID=2618316 RepID=UPI003983140E